MLKLYQYCFKLFFEQHFVGFGLIYLLCVLYFSCLLWLVCCGCMCGTQVCANTPLVGRQVGMKMLIQTHFSWVVGKGNFSSGVGLVSTSRTFISSHLPKWKTLFLKNQVACILGETGIFDFTNGNNPKNVHDRRKYKVQNCVWVSEGGIVVCKV